MLDTYKEEGFAAAHRLAKHCPTNRVAEATQRLYDAFTAQAMGTFHEIITYNAPEANVVEMSFDSVKYLSAERIGRSIDAFFSSSGASLLGHAYELASIAKWEGGEMAFMSGGWFLGDIPKPNFNYVASFLQGTTQNPTLAGLLAALRLVSDWYQPWRNTMPEMRGGRTSGVGVYYYPMSSETEEAIGFAASVVVEAAGGTPTAAPPAEEGAEGAPAQPLGATTPEQAQAMEERLADQALFNGLKCHIEENLLHYMRPIWLAEDAAQRHARLTRQLLGGTAEETMLATLIEDRLLGFHLNCSVFPVRMGPELEAALEEAIRSEKLPDRWPAPQGPQNLIAWMHKTSTRTRSAVQTHFDRLANDRFQASARILLDQSIQQALAYVENCGTPATQESGQGGEPPPDTAAFAGGGIHR